MTLLFLVPFFSLPWTLQAESSGGVSGHIEGGGRIFVVRPHRTDRGKFEEYRDYPKGGVLNKLFLQYESETPYRMELEVREPGEEDQSFLLRASKLGTVTFEFEWDQTPHVFSKASGSPYIETNRGVFDLNGEIQNRLQGAAAADRPSLLSDFLTPTPGIDLKNRWDGARFGMTWTPSSTWTLQSKYNFTQKDGSRPVGTTFYFTNQVELPEAIDQIIHDVDLSAEWNNRKGYVSMGYGFSAFVNNLDVLTWDNPLRATDAAGNPSRGRFVLPPDNIAHLATLSAGIHLPWKSFLRGTFSYGLRFQNDDFYPHTINTGINSALLALPRTGLQGAIHTRFGNIQWTGRPYQNLGVNFYYRIYNQNDDTPNVTFNGQVATDVNLVSEAVTRARFDYIKQTAGLDFSWHLAKMLDFKTGYEWEHWNRNRFHREVSTTTEHIPSMALDYKPYSWLWLRSSYSYAMHLIGTYNTFAHLSHTIGDEVDASNSDAQDVNLRKFDEANRRRHKGDISVFLTPNDQWSFTPVFSLIRNSYTDSTLGLQKELGWSAGGDVTWTPNDRVSFYANYMREEYDARQRSRYREPAAQMSNTTYDWVANNADIADTGSFSTEVVLKPKILKLHLGGDVMHAISRMRAVNPTTPAGGTAAQNTSATVENFPDIRDFIYHLEASLLYNIKERWSTKLAYVFEDYNTSNFQQEKIGVYNGGLDANSNTSIYLGAQIRDYVTHWIGITASYQFN